MQKQKTCQFNIKKICCVGAGYVGGPSMAVLAKKCPHIIVNVVDINKKKIEEWNSSDLNQLPIYEPGLSEIIDKTRNKNLFFSTEIDKCIEEADMVFISVNTPTKTRGIGAGQTIDLKWVESCARRISNKASGHTIVVEKSTLPVKTAETIKVILDSASINYEKKNKTFSVLSNPEFLAEGTAIENLTYPDRVLIGGENYKAVNSLKEIYLNWVQNEKIICTNLWSSELSKLTANAFLAQRVSSINSISAICEATGANIKEVSRAVGMDVRIGNKFLKAGPGFGGSCFKKDILNLVYISSYFGLVEVAEFWEQVIKINEWQQNRIYKIIVEKLFGNVTGKKIAFLGFSFKANTNDIRESSAINIGRFLLREGAKLLIHDPKVSSVQVDFAFKNINLKHDDLNGTWIKESNLMDVFVGADAAIILTEWNDYLKLDWVEVSKKMRKPAWIFDTRSLLDKEKIIKAGLNFWSIGLGS